MSEGGDVVTTLEDLDGTIATVSELNGTISDIIDASGINFDFLVGDVSNEFLSNGTLHFDLVDDEDDATIHCLLFNANRRAADFEEGERIAVKGQLNYYEKRGSCSIFVSDAVPLGESHYHLKIERLREALREEGLFEEDVKTPLPELPEQIGIVTASGSDAEEDAINGIRSRHPDVSIFLADSRVQGDRAVEEICKALSYFDQFTPVDVIVITRGGGSDQDLHAFNSEGVSRMIASTDTPVVTAIGHENDRPIVDDVADARAMTPTEIGATVVPSKAQLQERNAELRDRLGNAYRQMTTAAVQEHRSQLSTAYDNHITSTLTEMQNALNATYTQHVQSGVAQLRNDLATAHRAFKQEKRHEEETEELESRQQLYKVAIAALLLLLCAVILAWLFL